MTEAIASAALLLICIFFFVLKKKGLLKEPARPVGKIEISNNGRVFCFDHDGVDIGPLSGKLSAELWEEILDHCDRKTRICGNNLSQFVSPGRSLTPFDFLFENGRLLQFNTHQVQHCDFRYDNSYYGIFILDENLDLDALLNRMFGGDRDRILFQGEIGKGPLRISMLSGLDRLFYRQACWYILYRLTTKKPKFMNDESEKPAQHSGEENTNHVLQEQERLAGEQQGAGEAELEVEKTEQQDLLAGEPAQPANEQLEEPASNEQAAADLQQEEANDERAPLKRYIFVASGIFKALLITDETVDVKNLLISRGITRDKIRFDGAPEEREGEFEKKNLDPEQLRHFEAAKRMIYYKR